MKEPAADGDEILGVTRAGTVITEKVAEEIAEEFERDGLDPVKVKRLYVGYPVRSAASSSGVAFPLSRSELDAVRRHARKEGRSFSDAIRAELKRRTDS
ncbi:MAG TPA: hypothetical protein VJU14_06265 [Solirubrobacterales bacterium]|nr:hypothetical protein [Solirubrobacterales bacterium]